MRGAGATVQLASFDAGSEPTDLSECDMFVHLGNFGAKPLAAPMAQSFVWIKQALANQVGRIMVITPFGGAFGQTSGNEDPLVIDGLAGIIRTVAYEYPEVVTRIVNVDPSTDGLEISRQLLVESTFSGSCTEIGYRQGKRYTVVPLEAKREDAGSTPIALDRNSVILVTGGARGITAKSVLALASRYGCHFAIVGRTAIAARQDDLELRTAADLSTIRKILITRGAKKPAEIEAQCQQTLAENQLAHTLSAIVKAGGSVDYYARDTRDSAAFATLIDELYAKHGKIDGFIHGAGILEDRFIKDKTPSSFTKVFDTKIEGTKVIAGKARAETKFVLFFSSVAGCFGNIGQVDYAAANDAMDRVAWWLNRRINGRCLTINWGPWDGTGMVTPELEREYHKRGIGLVQPDEGVDAMLSELLSGNRDQVQVIYMCAELSHMTRVHETDEKTVA
jgi:NAD(P)-dependent dehydrogenase (short-subunit alcohol dehydrogenase family)